MLSRVLSLLATERWFDVAMPFEKTINLTQGACAWLMLTRQGVCDTYVKFSDRMSLEREARRCEEASRCYPALVPLFVGYANKDGMEVLVCRAVEHRSINVREGRVFADLVRYFSSMPATRLPSQLTPLLNAELSTSLHDYFAANPMQDLAFRCLNGELARRAACLPNMPQHGDLVLNNIGQLRSGRVVVFDWEDFGASCLPGLDLFTLELSMAGDAPAMLAARSRAAAPTQVFMRDACAAMQLDFGDYAQLTPLYALVFRYLKRNYGPGVRERIDRVLLDLAER